MARSLHTFCNLLKHLLNNLGLFFIYLYMCVMLS